MDAGGMHKLAKVLRQIAAEVTSDEGEQVSATDSLVGMDVFSHSPTTVSEVSRRTGVVQSQVSAVVADMVRMGVVVTSKDPADRRRTLLTVPAEARAQYGSSRGSRDPRSVVTSHLATNHMPHSPADVERVMRALDALSVLLPTAAQREIPKFHRHA